MSMQGKKLFFLYNPKAGRGQVRLFLSEMVDLFVKAGYEVTVYPTQDKDDAMYRVARLAGEYDRVICCGGDGTLNETVAGMLSRENRVPIGYIPAGTTNDFAKSLGIPTELKDAAAIAAGGRLFPCDVGEFNGNTFDYIAAFGVFTEVSYETGHRMKTVLGHAAYVVNGPKSLIPIPSYHMEVEVNGETVEGNFSYGMISNTTSVGGIKNLAGSTVALDDGKFEVTFVRTPKNPWMVRSILTNLLQKGDANSPYIYCCKADSLTIRSEEAVAWTLDGEFGGSQTDVRIRNRMREITFIVPEEESTEAHGEEVQKSEDP